MILSPGISLSFVILEIQVHDLYRECCPLMCHASIIAKLYVDSSLLEKSPLHWRRTMSCLEPQTPASMSYTGSFSASPSPTLSTTELRYDSPATYPPATRCSRCAKRSAPGYESSLMKECKRCFLVRYCVRRPFVPRGD